MSRLALLYTLVFIEGYAVLAAELIAIRNLIGYVGNGSDIVSIIIAGVLLPLAVGYYYGGTKHKAGISVRRLLIRNFTIATAFLAFGLSMMVMDTFFMLLVQKAQLVNRLMLAPIYVMVFLVPPVFLLGQTIPLLTRYFRVESAGSVAGRMLFWSTLGSFLGSVFTTLVVMAFFGVHVATLLVVTLLVVAIALLNRALTFRSMAIPVLVLLACLGLNSNYIFGKVGIVYQNTYNTARIHTARDGMKVLMLNNGTSSLYNPANGDTGPLNVKAEEILLDPIMGKEPKRDILVIGAGGFTFGMRDHLHNYTYVDIDPDLKKVSEEYFLGQKLTPNKTFVPEAARSWLIDAIAKKKKFDLVYIDVFNGEIWVPEDLITQDFFRQVKQVLKPDGVVGTNFIVSPNYTNDYSLALEDTFRSVFPAATRVPISKFNAWDRSPYYIMNFVFVGYNQASDKFGNIYTDNKNSVIWDKPSMRNY